MKLFARMDERFLIIEIFIRDQTIGFSFRLEKDLKYPAILSAGSRKR